MYAFCRGNVVSTAYVRVSTRSGFPLVARKHARRLKIVSGAEAKEAMAKGEKAMGNGVTDCPSPNLAVAEDMLDFINTAWTQFHAVGVQIKTPSYFQYFSARL